MSTRPVLLCVDGGAVDEMLAAALPLLGGGLLWLPAHIVDARGERDLGLLRRGIPGAGPLTSQQQDAIDRAASDHARGVLEIARAALERRGLEYAEPHLGHGDPGHEICTLAASLQAHVILLQANRRQLKPPAGPHSVGHTARFVLDHAPCPVLLLR
jgi:nucleotide-binding universal stress UspA family protein